MHKRKDFNMNALVDNCFFVINLSFKPILITVLKFQKIYHVTHKPNGKGRHLGQWNFINVCTNKIICSTENIFKITLLLVLYICKNLKW